MNSEVQVPRPKLKIFHVDGAGCRPDGSGSRFGWVRVGTDKQRMTFVDRLKNNAAEYRGLLSVLKYLAPGSRASICTDSMLVCEQFNGRWAVRNPDLRDLLHGARELIKEKELEVEVMWIPREKNLAGKLLDRN